MRHTLKRSTSVAALTAAAFSFAASSAGYAQEQDADEDLDNLFTEEIVVTGSRIRRPSQFDSAAPLENIGQEQISAIGASQPSDIIQTLTINTGSQNTPDAFTQNFNVGTAQYNLRGLGVASTLVLLNGRRSVLSGATTNDGSNFVDINSLVPQIAIERIEILKDGAAAIYGTDAVAGVVNHITRNGFEGVEISGQYENITGDSVGYTIEGLVGVQSDRGSAIASLSYFDRSELTSGERGLPGAQIADVSGVGQPGSFLLPSTPQFAPGFAELFPAGLIPSEGAFQATFAGGFDSNGNGIADIFEELSPTPSFFNDPTCAAVSQIDSDVIPAATFPAGTCNFSFADDFTIVPEDSRFQGFASADYEVTEWLTAYAEVGFARNLAGRGVSPSFPVTTTFPVSSSFDGDPNTIDTPFFPFVTANPFGVPATSQQLLARSIGALGQRSPNSFESNTFRGVFGVTGDLGALTGGLLESWTYDVSYIYGINEFNVTQEDVVESRYIDSLAGLGGVGCAAGSQPGDPGCFFFNPTGTNVLAQVGLLNASTVPFTREDGTTVNVPIANSDEVVGFITGELLLQAESRFEAYEATATGELPFTIPGAPAPIAMAIGWQYRDSFFANDFDPVSEEGDFLFLVGGNDFEDQQDVFAGFVEFDIPLHDWLTVNGAVRVEDYGGAIGRTVDPKGSLLFRPADSFQIRFSGGTSFRAPSVFQLAGFQTSLVEIADPISGTSAFLGVQTIGNPDLQPEQARTFNAGMSWEPLRTFNLFDERFQDLEINVDHFRFNFTDIIIQENAQAIVDADPFDPAINRTAAGTISDITTQFANASSLRTSGFDFNVNYTIDAGRIGIFRPSFAGTYILEYELEDPQAGTIDGAGNRNFTNFGTSAPEFRFNFGLGWALDRYSANVFVRRIGSYIDDQVGADGVAGTTIDSQTTVDLQFNVALPGVSDFEGPRLSIGAINITDEDPPIVITNGGFDSRVHDPRGRVFYFRVTQTF